MNPEPGNELQFKVSLARAEQFMNELRRLGFDVGHDADYQDPTNFMTVIVRDVPAGRRRLLVDTANRYATLLKHNNPGPEQRRTLHRAIAPGNAEPNKTHYFCEGCKSPLSWCEKHNMYHHAFSFSPECRSVDNPGNPGEKTVHGYNYRVRIWYPNAPENSTEGMILAAYDEDLAKEIQRQYPGVTYEIISKEPVLGDPQEERKKVVERMRKEYVKEQVKRVLLDNDCSLIEKCNPGGDDNLRDRLIAEIIKNRMEAWNRGVKGVRPWSENDLTELRSMTTAELEQTAKLTTQLSFAPSGESQGYPQRKWAASQVWAACKQAGVPVEERDVLVKHYQETGELPFQTWPSLRLIESWPEQPQQTPYERGYLESQQKIEIAHEQREEAGGTFDLVVCADRTWKLITPEGEAEGRYDEKGYSHEAKYQHPFIRDWINEQGEILFGKVPSWQIDPELERKAQQNWDVLPTTSRLQYLTTYVKPSVPSAENFSQSSWASLPNNIKDFIRHAYAGEQAGNRYVVEAEVTSRRIYYVTAENEEDAQQKIKNRDYHDEREKGDYWWEFKFTEVRPARPDESQYYP